MRPGLRNTADLRSLAFLVSLSALYAFHWLSGWHVLLLPTVLLAISACVVKHNQIHSPLFASPILNRFFNVWLSLLTGTSTTGIRMAHNQRHHRSNQSPDDFVRSSLVCERSAAVALLIFFPLVVRETWRQTGVDAARLSRRSSALRRLLYFEKAAVACFCAVLLVADWRLFCWVFVLPWLVSQWFLVTINLLQHDGLDAEDALLDSRNMTGVWSNWLFLNNGYHTAHHQRPALHWSELPDFHRREIRPHLSENLESASLPMLFLDWMAGRAKNSATKPVREPLEST